MILFFDLIAKKKLFPHAIIKFDKPDTYKLYEQEKKMEFSRNQLSSFSYVEVLKNNHMVCELNIHCKTSLKMNMFVVEMMITL